MRWIWHLAGDPPHVIEARLGILGGETIFLDGEVASQLSSLGLRSEHRVTLPEGEELRVEVRSYLGLVPVCRLLRGTEELPAASAPSAPLAVGLLALGGFLAFALPRLAGSAFPPHVGQAAGALLLVVAPLSLAYSWRRRPPA